MQEPSPHNKEPVWHVVCQESSIDARPHPTTSDLNLEVYTLASLVWGLAQEHASVWDQVHR